MTCACGYAQEMHDGLGKCPLCACGDFPDAHELTSRERACLCACGADSRFHITPGDTCPLCDRAEPHACRWARYEFGPCCGRRSKTTGNWLMLRQSSFRTPDPEPERVEWCGMRVVPAPKAEIEELDRQLALADAVRPPQVAARSPMGPGEIAGAGAKKQATKVGRMALAAGWLVEALYWRAGDGTEGCALRLAGPDGVRAVATWARKPGHVGELVGWSAGGAYAWRPGSPAFPARVALAQLDDMLGTC